MNNDDEALQVVNSELLEFERQGEEGDKYGRVQGPSLEDTKFSSFREPPVESNKAMKKRGGLSTTVSPQEKNRRAQKRLRERNKAKMKLKTERLKSANEELSKLTSENTTLITRYNTLEKVLCLKDEQIHSLLNQLPVTAMDSQYQGNARSSQVPLYSKCTTEDLNDEDIAGKPIDPEGLKSTSGASVLASWKKFVGKLGVLLMHGDEIPSDTSQETEKVTDKVLSALCQGDQVWSQTALLNPTNFQLLIQARLDGGSSGISVDDKTFWTSVVASMQLNHKQECQIIALKDIFTERMKKIMAARQRIMGEMQLVPATDRPSVAQPVVSETRRINEATQELHSNMQAEHVCTVVFAGSIFKTVLSQLQKARCIVQSYPFHPDMLQIASIISESHECKIMNQPVSD